MAKSSTTKVKSSAKSADKITYGKLRKYNFMAAALHGAQGILVLILSDPHKGLMPVTASFLTQDKLASSAAGHPVLSAASHHLFDINLAYLVAIFFFISALAHLLVATAKRKTYESDLKKGINRIRWIEYAFSASIMMVAIALLTGIFDFASLLMIFVLMAIMSLLGLVMELRNQGIKKVDWASYYLGVLAGVTPWLVILTYVWNAHINGNGVPGFVYFIYVSLFILFTSFALNMYFQYKKLGHWSNYLYGERAYIILSFVAKTALAWQVFAGTLR